MRHSKCIHDLRNVFLSGTYNYVAFTFSGGDAHCVSVAKETDGDHSDKGNESTHSKSHGIYADRGSAYIDVADGTGRNPSCKACSHQHESNEHKQYCRYATWPHYI